MKRLFPIAISLLFALGGCNTSSDPEPDIPDTPADAGLAEVVVLAYEPAPGQFINELPKASAADTDASMREKVRKALCEGSVVSLGAWGGSVTLRLNTPVENHAGADFRILGNAIITGSDASGRPYGSAEPGIVEVMYDANANGQPDEQWYELRGEACAQAVRGLSVTYHAPAADATNEQYIQWTASDGSDGWMNRVESHHKQPFFPLWQSASTVTKTGTRLPDNGFLDAATGQYHLRCMDGYADTYPINDNRGDLDIANAIDAQGNSVSLTRIDFIRVTTGVLQTNGQLGECSTEIAGIKVL